LNVGLAERTRIGDHTPEQATQLCQEMGMRFNVENHPQTNAAEL
jgi:hypothetical protein